MLKTGKKMVIYHPHMHMFHFLIKILNKNGVVVLTITSCCSYVVLTITTEIKLLFEDSLLQSVIELVPVEHGLH